MAMADLGLDGPVADGRTWDGPAGRVPAMVGRVADGLTADSQVRAGRVPDRRAGVPATAAPEPGVPAVAAPARAARVAAIPARVSLRVGPERVVPVGDRGTIDPVAEGRAPVSPMAGNPVRVVPVDALAMDGLEMADLAMDGPERVADVRP